jgi:hypothetical protein
MLMFVIVSDEQLKTAGQRFPHLTPQTKEAYWYRTMFHDLFPQPAAEKTVMVIILILMKIFFFFFFLFIFKGMDAELVCFQRPEWTRPKSARTSS